MTPWTPHRFLRKSSTFATSRELWCTKLDRFLGALFPVVDFAFPLEETYLPDRQLIVPAEVGKLDALVLPSLFSVEFNTS